MLFSLSSSSSLDRIPLLALDTYADIISSILPSAYLTYLVFTYMSKGTNAFTSAPNNFVIQKSIGEFRLQTTLYFVVGIDFHFTIHYNIRDDGLTLSHSLIIHKTVLSTLPPYLYKLSSVSDEVHPALHALHSLRILLHLHALIFQLKSDADQIVSQLVRLLC